MNHRAAISFVLMLGVSAATFSASAETQPAGECEATVTDADPPKADEPKATTAAEQVKAAATNFQKFFAGIKTELFERDFFLEVAKLGLLADEHVLMIGPPGNAKSMGVDLIIDNIVEDKTGETSVYKIQMTPETSLSETHGVIDYKKITEENIQTRKWEQGLLSAKLVFIDEFFDARANAIRNNLMALNEREHAQGRERIKGITQTGFAATNKYINEVYEKAGDDGPKAVIDRFAFVTFVPGDLEDLSSAMRLIQESPVKRPGRMTFQDIDLLRAKVKEVKIPDYVARMLTLMFARMKAQTEALEQSEKKRFLEQKKSGLNPLPPYRSTKYYSPRTLRKAGKILRALVVNDWIESGGERPLSANSLDLEKMVKFFTMNSYNDEFLTHLEETTVNPNEKIQVMTVLKERGMFRDIYQDMMTQVNSRAAVLTEIEMQREAAVTAELKKELVEKMIVAMLETVVTSTNDGTIREMSEEGLASQYIRESLEYSLREMLGEEYEKTVAVQVKALQEEQARRIAEAERAEKERVQKELEEARKRELYARKFQELKQKFGTASNITQVQYHAGSGRSNRVHYAAHVGPDKIDILSLANGYLRTDSIRLTDFAASGEINRAQIDQNEHVVKITPLGPEKYLFWFGMFGRIFENNVLSKAKIILETHQNQTISDNSMNGKFWLMDRNDYKFGIISNANPSDVEWTDFRDFTMEGSGDGVEYTLDYFVRDTAQPTTRFVVAKEKGVAHIYATDSSFSIPVLYRIDLNAKKITVLTKHDGEVNNFGNFSAMASANAVSNRAARILIDGRVHEGGTYLAEAFLYDLTGERPDIRVKFKVKDSHFQQFQGRVFDISPDGTYIVLRTPNNVALMGVDLKTGEAFDIAVPANIGGITRVQFIDRNHIFYQAQDAFYVVRLPKAE